MKKSLLSFLIFLPICLMAQMEFAPEEAIWYYRKSPYDVVHLKPDTATVMIDSMVFKRLLMYNAQEEVKNVFYLRSEDNRVYHHIEDTTYMLFDFDAQPGDTMSIPLLKYDMKTIACWGPRVIDSVTTTIIDNVPLKTIHYKFIFGHSPTECIPEYWHPEFLYGAYVERLGEQHGFMFNEYQWKWDYSYVLACYADDSISVMRYVFNLPCDTVVSTRNIDLQNAITLFPNPAQNRLTIDPPMNVDAVYRIVNLGGTVVGKGILRRSENEIFLPGLPAGFYTLHLVFEDRFRALVFSIVN